VSATAAVGAQAKTTKTAGGRLGALAGLAFAFLFLMGTATLNIPRGASDAKLLAWWADSGNQTTAIVSMYLFIVAGLCFLVFLAKLRSRLLVAEGGTGELTSLVVASGAVFVAMLLVAVASRSRHAPLPAPDRIRRARHRRTAGSRRHNGDDVVADRADGGVRPLAGVARLGDRAGDRRRGGRARGNGRNPSDLDLGPGRQHRDAARSALASRTEFCHRRQQETPEQPRCSCSVGLGRSLPAGTLQVLIAGWRSTFAGRSASRAAQRRPQNVEGACQCRAFACPLRSRQAGGTRRARLANDALYRLRSSRPPNSRR
jgi:hypothetical protein